MLRTDLAVAAVFLSLATAGCSGGAESQEAPPPPEVTVATPLASEIVDWDDLCRPVRSPRECRRKAASLPAIWSAPLPRRRNMSAAGSCSSRSTHGRRRHSSTRRGRSLPEPRRRLVNARTELARSRTLAAQRAASVEEVEQRQAALRSANADVSAAAALPFARVSSMSASLGSLAPISGQVSERRVDPGNAVTADETVLTTVVSTNPLHFAFDGSEALAAPLPAAERLCRDRCTGPDPPSGRSAICPRRPARLRRQCPELRRGNHPRAGGRAQSRRLPEARDDGPSAARRPLRPIARCWCPTRRSSPMRRGASSMSSTAAERSPSVRSSSAR